MIYNNMGVRFLGADDLELSGSIVQNNIPVLEQNYVEKMNTKNGFSEKRMFRKIASIPIAAVLKAHQDGYNLDDTKDLYRFLADENKEYQTVDHILSPRNTHIIMK